MLCPDTKTVYLKTNKPKTSKITYNLIVFLIAHSLHMCVCVGGGGGAEVGGSIKEGERIEISCGIVLRGEFLMQF